MHFRQNYNSISLPGPVVERPISVLHYGTRDMLKLHIFQDQGK